VTKVQDGFEDQIPPGFGELDSKEELSGNIIMLMTEQNGEKYYIMYAHLIKGSIQVKPGDRIVKGQVIAKVGNTGHSAAPHLHLQVMTADDAIKAEGLPFVFKQAKIQGTADIISMDYGQWKWNKKLDKEYTVYDNIIPLTNQVLDFSE
jgi:murein DD-endopeptidase MepM/ murein hydrolase activator NlpD